MTTPNDIRLTVIIVTYNHENWIAKCIDSILAQKTKFKYIVKIFDDCSTDGTSDIIRKYKSLYPEKVHTTIREKNLGVVDNVYPALCNISTEYWCVIDGDDYLTYEHKFQEQVDILDAHPNCSFCGASSVYHDIKTNSFTPDLGDKYKEDTIFNFEEAPYLHVSSRMFRNILDFSKEDKNQITWDIFTFYKFLSLASVYYINKPMSVYNITGDGVYSQLNDAQKRKQNLKTFYELDMFLEFKYSYFFRKHYLPEYADPEFKMKIPYWKRKLIKLTTKACERINL